MLRAISTTDYQEFSQFLESVCGVMLGDDKQYLVSGRMNTLLQETGLATLGELVNRARANDGQKLRTRIIDAMSTNETSWFRDRHPFDILSSDILPALAKAEVRQLRIWCAACSSGEEAFSIALTVKDFMDRRPGWSPDQVSIVASDISSLKLSEALSAEYSPRALERGLDADYRRRYFEQQNGLWRPKDEVRQLVNFRFFNLKETGSWRSLGKFNVVFCRNVLIYFSDELKRKILEHVADTLDPSGYLFLGASESLGDCGHLFKMEFRNPGVVFRPKSRM